MRTLRIAMVLIGILVLFTGAVGTNGRLEAGQTAQFISVNGSDKPFPEFAGKTPQTNTAIAVVTPVALVNPKPALGPSLPPQVKSSPVVAPSPTPSPASSAKPKPVEPPAPSATTIASPEAVREASAQFAAMAKNCKKKAKELKRAERKLKKLKARLAKLEAERIRSAGYVKEARTDLASAKSPRQKKLFGQLFTNAVTDHQHLETAIGSAQTATAALEGQIGTLVAEAKSLPVPKA